MIAKDLDVLKDTPPCLDLCTASTPGSSPILTDSCAGQSASTGHLDRSFRRATLATRPADGVCQREQQVLT